NVWVNLTVVTVDVGGARSSLAMIAAEELGIPYDKVKTSIGDTKSLGHNDMTEGSRGTFSSGMATIYAAREAIGVLKQRAAQTWGIPEEDVIWENGQAIATGKRHSNLPPLSLAEIAAKAGRTGGPIAGHNEVVADGAGMGFASHICDVEVDPETGRSSIVRYTVVQDAGKAINPDYVEGQFQGGATQGIGWALN
ncbi:MAG TPA: oxidoreductase, partial [Gammaproteobacteria bacterium]|nr:oxidoreductase [Gammaproteobacteria bacterium]